MASSLQDAQLWAEKSHGSASTDDMCKVVASMRFASLRGIKLRSDRQPNKIFVENIQRAPGRWAPMVLATGRPDGAAWIRVTIDANHWARLAYQFGHELGHVLSNSWGAGAEPRKPCQWVEEVLVESFSLRGLFELAQRWETDPPYPHWKEYAPYLASYAETELSRYYRLAKKADIRLDAGMSVAYRSRLDQLLTLGTHAKALVPTMVSIFRNNPPLLEDLGGLNRWPSKSSEPLQTYFDLWARSCVELGLPGLLPAKIKGMLAVAGCL
jgi:hypothetical protein